MAIRPGRAGAVLRKSDQRTDVPWTWIQRLRSLSCSVTHRGQRPITETPCAETDIVDVTAPGSFAFPRAGRADRIALDHLASWTENQDPGVKHFSGTATYAKDIDLPRHGGPIAALMLDLGSVKYHRQYL